ncbi:hypothetical protein BC941DRAFT_427423 [Chlamydoabsidia padenii]|nr:hypothetical protein BC941DRAFT_427423 [Chlamydoabsidia padenii]
MLTTTKNHGAGGPSTSKIYTGKVNDKQRRDGNNLQFKKLLSERNKKLDELQQIETVLQTHMPQFLKKDASTTIDKTDTADKGGGTNHTKATVAFSLLGDLIDECIYDVTFQVHYDLKRANTPCQICQTKCCCYVKKPGLDVFGNSFNTNNLPYHECVNCNKAISSSRYAPHLEKCLGLAGRQSSRVANRRLGSSSPAHNEGESSENKRKKGNHINSTRLHDLKSDVYSKVDGSQIKKKRKQDIAQSSRVIMNDPPHLGLPLHNSSRPNYDI